MAEFAELVDDYNPHREKVYPLFSSYFNDPTMTKIKNIDNYSVYVAKLHSLLIIEFRYIIAIIYKDNKNIGYTTKLSNLHWETLQTRTLPEDHKIAFHTYIPSRVPYLDHKIKLIHQDETQYKYRTENLPVIVTLLPKTKGHLEYNKEGTIINAIETYQTIISFSI